MHEKENPPSSQFHYKNPHLQRKNLSKAIKIDLYGEASNLEGFEENIQIVNSKVIMFNLGQNSRRLQKAFSHSQASLHILFVRGVPAHFDH